MKTHCKKSSSIILSILLALAFQGFFLGATFGDDEKPVPAGSERADASGKVQPKKPLTRQRLPEPSTVARVREAVPTFFGAPPESIGNGQDAGAIMAPPLPGVAPVEAPGVDPDFLAEFQRQLGETFRREGTDAVADLVGAMAGDPVQVNRLRALAGVGQSVRIETDIHPNEKYAIEWMNRRLARMQLPKVQFVGRIQINADGEATLPDPTGAPDPGSVSGMKRFRYSAGPGVALAATLLSIRGFHADKPSDYLLLILPPLGAGLTTVALEYIFGQPKLNAIFWRQAWRCWGLGGERWNWLFGRAVNVGVNTIYDLTGKYAAVFAGMVPLLWGAHPMADPGLIFGVAALGALEGGLRFHLAVGQTQTDLTTEVRRGAINGDTYFRIESGAVGWNNGARVGGWVIKGPWSSLAMWGYFLTKTLPQLVKTHIQPPLHDRAVGRAIAPESAPRANFWERCAGAVAQLNWLNLPRMRR